MKRFVSILSILIIMLSMVGCAELINTEHETVNVEVIDSYYSDEWMQPIWSGKSMIIIPHDAEYQIYVTYNDVRYMLNDPDTYYVYKDRIGEIVPATLEIRTYDDGTVKYDITALG